MEYKITAFLGRKCSLPMKRSVLRPNHSVTAMSDVINDVFRA